MDARTLLDKAARQPNNLRFEELVALVEAFGFRLSRIRGSHHMFTRPGLIQQVNLQPDGGKAKPYQVRAFVRLVETAKLTLEERE
ncbi:MAG: type II toxin-antitoxin system HicA family toxin [Chloroflexi bacterium]|nr:type II toxin-antitoxin system HicA family toxin [Chloroflexota bacterium]